EFKSTDGTLSQARLQVEEYAELWERDATPPSWRPSSLTCFGRWGLHMGMIWRRGLRSSRGLRRCSWGLQRRPRRRGFGLI
ncbi:MAG TPA: hypothetical protein VFH51_15100, partial [Myxococcota bacterium]|nr:hypothetical protein [Myxococcota bacterium]